MFLSLVFSFRNEEDVLDELIGRTVRTLETIDTNYELVFVNDSSTDRSLEILNSHRAAHPNIRIITMSRQFGISPCILADLKFSKDNIARLSWLMKIPLLISGH